MSKGYTISPGPDGRQDQINHLSLMQINISEWQNIGGQDQTLISTSKLQMINSEQILKNSNV
jgi:hypothetical protein